MCSRRADTIVRTDGFVTLLPLLSHTVFKDSLLHFGVRTTCLVNSFCALTGVVFSVRHSHLHPIDLLRRFLLALLSTEETTLYLDYWWIDGVHFPLP